MNRVAGRALAVWILILAFAVGTVFFLGEYFMEAEDWVMFSGSRHVYDGSSLGSGVITDQNGILLMDLSGDRQYAQSALVRRSTLHWVGDRLGNISAPILTEYSSEMVGYDPFNGVYSYGSNAGQMELTLYAQVQAAALEALGDRSGTVAVYNYKTGEILCAVSTPNYDPDDVPDIAGDETGLYDGVYMNRFTQSVYIPGSIFKIVTMAAALDALPDIRSQSFVCEGKYMAGFGDITCEQVHGTQALEDAFANSCNCAFAQIAQQLGEETLLRYIEQFAVLESVSFDGITTAAGSVELENVTEEELAWTAIGQHKDQINACAFLRFVGAIANGGMASEPYVVREISVGAKTTYEAETRRADRILSTTTAQLLQEYMNYNVDVKYGAENFRGLTVCAKSGTAEVGGGQRPNAMFAGFLTDEEYPLAFIVVVENGGYGSTTCIPILQAVLEACTQAMDG